MSRVARLGAFIVGTLAVLAAGVFIIGSKEYLFSSTYQLRAQFDNVAGLAAGANVQVGGVQSGTVRSIALPHKPGERVTVVMDLDKATHEIIKQDSVASIETEGVLGNQYMAISFGSAGQPDVKNGDTLQSKPPLAIADLINKANSLLDGSQLAILNTVQATAHLNSVTSKIDTGQGTVGALVNDKQLYNNLQETTSTLRDTTIKAQAGVTDFQENMEALKHNFLLSGYFKKRGYEDSSELVANEIGSLPVESPLKVFTYSSMQLFDGRDSAKLKNQKTLDASGEYLAKSQYGLAVIVVSAGMQGDTQKQLVLTEARAMVIREYLVGTFGFDDSRLKTFGEGKQSGVGSDADWGTIQILFYPAGVQAPPVKEPPAPLPTRIAADRETGGSAGPAPKP
jgi:phospholipid/cholesterol/gamma-HCH transport system substrate-binding protein